MSNFFHGRFREPALVFLAYFLLTIGMTWPVAADLLTQVAGSGVDIWSHLWTFAWVRDSLLQGHNPYFTTRIFYPQGVSLGSHNIAWLQILLWIPLQALLGVVAGYNLLFLAMLAFNGLGMYWLAGDVIGSRPAAFFSGLIYAFWPYVLSHNDHPNMMVVGFLPLALLYLKRAMAERGWRNVALAAVFLSLTAWARWHLLIMGGIVVGLYVLYQTAVRPRRWQSLKSAMIVAALGALLTLPIAVPVIGRQLSRDHPQDLFIDEQEEKQTDLLAYFLPSTLHTLADSDTAHLFDALYASAAIYSQTRTPFIGYSIIALAVLSLLRRPRRSRFWLLAAVVLILLALGPELRFNGRLYPAIPMPYRLVEDVFFIRVLRAPDRFNVFLGLPIAVLAGLGLQSLLAAQPSARRAALLAGLAGLLVLAEYSPVPFPQSDPAVPAWLAGLSDDPDEYAIAQLPNDLFGPNKRYMFYQISHGKPLVNGKVARTPREALAFWRSTPFLENLSRSRLDFEMADVTHRLRPLAEAGVRYLVFDKSAYPEGELIRWRDWLSFAPAHEDDQLLVYHTAPHIGRDFELAHTLADSIGFVAASHAPEEAVQGGALKVDVRWAATGRPGRDHDACLTLHDGTGTAVADRCRPLSPDRPTSQWEADELVRDFTVWPIPADFPPGDYTLTLSLQDAGRPFEFGPVTVYPFQPAVETALDWSGRFALRGYTLQQTPDMLDLTLFWQAEQSMTTSYKWFVHLIDPTTGQVVAQRDAIPRDWTYPTDIWEPGEVVRERLALPLDDVPSGRYELWVGAYDWTRNWRLAVTAGNPSTGSGRAPGQDDLLTRRGAARLTTIER